MSKSRFSISVVVPVYNEEQNLAGTVSKLDQFLDDLFSKYEIIIVDSDSTDNTPKIASALSKGLSSVSSIRQSVRRGFGNGLREGYANCKNDLVWYVDADCPFDLGALRRALVLIEDAEAVIGIKKGSHETFMRWLFSKGYNYLVRLVFLLPFKDVNFSFKLIRNRALKKLDLQSDGWFVDTEILLELRRHKLRVKEFPVKFIIRDSGDSKVTIGPSIVNGFLKEIIDYKRRKKR